MQLGKSEWRTTAKGQERCFLLTNGLGGYSSLTVVGSNNRNDHALLMGALKAPNYRFHYVTNLLEEIQTKEKCYELSTQEYVTKTKNKTGFEYLEMMTYDWLPEWTYRAEGIAVRKQLVMTYGENTVGIRYIVSNASGKKASLKVTPLLRFTQKDEQMGQAQDFEVTQHEIKSNGQSLFFYTNGKVTKDSSTERIKDLYYDYDARDGRDSVGWCAKNHTITFEITDKHQEFYLIYSDQDKEHEINQMILNETNRQQTLEETAGLKNPAARRLVRSADQFVSYRDSTKGDTIIAGYPFFGDWGRDTCIAMIGCTITTKQFEKAKSIFRTFQSYCSDGVMPNMFPEGKNEPFYNTADASLLFIEAIYKYYQATQDISFIKEMYPCMKEIITCYQNGTKNHIIMDSDGLIKAGDGLEQVTWMDVRIGDYLPTPRHGKPVEINAYWYNALCIMNEFEKLFGSDDKSYQTLSKKVKESFLKKFWNEEKGCLKDVLTEKSSDPAETQVRCNQVWALSLSFMMPDFNQAQSILRVIEEELYTPYGLRSLSINDKEFHPFCKGNQFDRDTAYHQGTVWVFPLGAYFRAKIRWMQEKTELHEIMHKLRMFETCLMEGCIGQAAEIYDGRNPNESRGCYAQAWSVGEMLRVYEALENTLEEN